MREISVLEITKAVKEMCIDANCILNEDIYEALEKSKKTEESPVGLELLCQITKNADIAKEKHMPICQDTGMVIVFLEVGQEVHFVDGLLEEAINEGVRQGYTEGFLRKSVVEDPFLRVNTQDNTPAIIHTRMIQGEKVKIDLAPKGFGSENMSRIFMMKPSDGIEGAKVAILQAVKDAGPNPCPPMVIGVGCGGSFEQCAYLAKKALLRPVGSQSEKPHIQEMEKELLEKMNDTGIGPQGLGGRTTVLGVNVETYPTHIAGMPIAVNISCHVTRHRQRII